MEKRIELILYLNLWKSAKSVDNFHLPLANSTFNTCGIVKLRKPFNHRLHRRLTTFNSTQIGYIKQWNSSQISIPINIVICPRAGLAFTLCLQLQRVNRESRRCACSPKNYHSATLEAMNSVRNLTIMFSCAL